MGKLASYQMELNYSEVELRPEEGRTSAMDIERTRRLIGGYAKWLIATGRGQNAIVGWDYYTCGQQLRIEQQAQIELFDWDPADRERMAEIASTRQ